MGKRRLEGLEEAVLSEKAEGMEIVRLAAAAAMKRGEVGERRKRVCGAHYSLPSPLLSSFSCDCGKWQTSSSMQRG